MNGRHNRISLDGMAPCLRCARWLHPTPKPLYLLAAAAFATTLLLLQVKPVTAAIFTANFTAATNDRFADDPSFVTSAFDLSGVGRALTGTADGGGHWGTLVDKNIFVSAEHYHAPNGTQLYFYPDNDPTSTPVVRTVLGGQNVGGSDLWIGHLDFALPPSIATYGWSQTAITPSNFTTTLENRFAYLSGISPTTSEYGTNKLTNHAVGENRIEDFEPNLDPLPAGGIVGDTLWSVENLPSDGGYTVETFEARIDTGDSGSPLFIVDGPNLELSGTAWLLGAVDLDPGPAEDLRDASVYTYTGNYAADIQQYIDDNLTMVIPEPSTVALLLSAALLVLVRRRWIE